MSDNIVPFRIDIPDSELRDLRARLTNTRWPEPETVPDWSQGVPVAYLRELCEYWADGYDWRVAERKANALPQFHTEIDGLDIHFLHIRSANEDALPVLLTNGWPGSFFEYLKVIDPLTDEFHLVIPTLPGYGFSGKPDAPGWGIERISDAWATLMDRLGYRRYGAHGSDWGTGITTSLALRHPDNLVGIHLQPPLAPPDPDTFDDLTDMEQAALEALKHSGEWESGYANLQATKPQTIGYALTDSPVGQCAWIVEKFHSWTDCAGHPENVLTRDEILDNVMLYWLTRSGASSARLYWESFRTVEGWFSDSASDLVKLPTGGTVFPREVPRVSRRWSAKRFADLRHWNEPERGGHFAALEQPDLFVTEVRTFFRQVR